MTLSPVGVSVIVLWAVFGCFLCIVAVGLRLYSRRLKGIGFSTNDYAALGSLVCALLHLLYKGNEVLTIERYSILL
jgi:hypothetical protein